MPADLTLTVEAYTSSALGNKCAATAKFWPNSTKKDVRIEYGLGNTLREAVNQAVNDLLDKELG